MLKLKGGGFKNKENKTLVEFAGNFSPYVLKSFLKIHLE